MRSRFVLVACIASIVIGVLFFIFTPSAPPAGGVMLSLGSASIHVELATTTAARARGLSGRAALAAGQGLLFVFSRDGQYSFWMKDMNFPIDIIWIAADGRVVEVASRVLPETYPRAFTSREPARFVLEVPSGFAAAKGIVPGALARDIPAGLAAE